MSKEETVVLIFSKNRALQLDLCLNSFYKCCTDIELPEIKIIYKTDAEHIGSYDMLINEHPFARFIEEKNFKNQIVELIKNNKFVLWLVDDTVCCNDFNMNSIITELNKNKKILGCSLRLGKNIKQCYSLNISFQAVPDFHPINDELNYYCWTESDMDWNYALEISSSIYRVNDLLSVIENNYFKTPNELESILYNNLNEFLNKPFLICYNTSRAFSIPCNKVQNVAPLNRYGKNINFYADQLKDLYLQGLRIDHNKFYKHLPSAVHEEAELF